MAEGIKLGKTSEKKKRFKIRGVSVYIETTATLLNPEEAWEPYQEKHTGATLLNPEEAWEPYQEKHTGAWTGTPITHRLNVAIARFKHIEPKLSKTDKTWASFVRRAGGKTLIILKSEKQACGSCAIAIESYSAILRFSTYGKVSIEVEHKKGYKAVDHLSLAGSPKIAITKLMNKIAAVIESGVEFPCED